jgi:hypothetical protein
MAKTTFSGPVRSENGFVSIAASGKTLALQAPANLSADTTLTFPNGAGSNGQYLKTDGTGALSWAAGDGTGTVTSVAVSGGTTGLTVSGSPVTTSGTITLAGTLAIANGGTNIGTVQALNADGAVNLTSMVTTLTTGSEDPLALTLADGTAGQIKIITMVVDGGEDAVVTPATALGFTALTFGEVGDGVTLVYTSAGWIIVGNNGVAI